MAAKATRFKGGREVATQAITPYDAGVDQIQRLLCDVTLTLFYI